MALLFPKAVLPWTPSKSKLSPKFLLPKLYGNFRVFRAKLTFFDALSQITPYTHMVSFAYYVTTSLFTGTKMKSYFYAG